VIIYIAGPMTGLPKFNAPAFKAMEIALSAKGHTVLSPANVVPMCNPEYIPHEGYMQICLSMLCLCNAIFMLNGWQNSMGAKRELKAALNRKMLIMTEDTIMEE
jgi:hypothetical protein